MYSLRRFLLSQLLGIAPVENAVQVARDGFLPLFYVIRNCARNVRFLYCMACGDDINLYFTITFASREVLIKVEYGIGLVCVGVLRGTYTYTA
jgi:hypothetical protein